MKKQTMTVLMCSGLIGALTPVAKADEWDQKTVVSFSGPVEVPGRVLLPGTYVFKLAESQIDRHIVQVFSKDEKVLYGTFLAIPDLRLEPAGKPIITFEERAVGSPEAVRAWFYPGQIYGHEFVYPKVKAVALAKANQHSVPSMPNELAESTAKPAPTLKEPHVMAMKQAPLKSQQPAGGEVEIAKVNKPNTPEAPALPREMPKTASQLPLVGLLGLLSLCGAIGLRSAARRSA